METSKYKPLNLPSALVEELKVWKTAYSAAYGRPVSYAEMIRSFLDFVPENEPDVEEELERITSKHPELLSKLGAYHSSANDGKKEESSNKLS